MGSGRRKPRQTGGGRNPAAGLRSAGGSGAGLGPGAEFDLIRGFLAEGAGRASRADVRVGPGDDCAVVVGQGIALTSDLSIEGVHFRRDWLTPQQIGHRAATASLSDLAAMAARPIGVLVSLALAPDDALFAAEIMVGIREAVESAGGALLGGDVSRAEQVMIDVVGVGEVAAPVLRSGARAGDEVWVTGTLGGAGRAVAELLAGRAAPPEAMAAFAALLARVAEARWLADRLVLSAMIDLSDGLGGDAAHIAAASGVALVLEGDAVPLHVSLARLEPPEALALALGGGEDYEICFTAPGGAVAERAEEFAGAFGVALTRVGWVEAGEGVHLIAEDGSRATLTSGGFQHFEGPA